MVGNDTGTEHTGDAVESAVEQASVDARDTTATAASALHEVTTAAASQAEDMNVRVTEAATTASRNASDAFGSARERLTSLSAPFSNPAFDGMRQSGEAFGKGLETSYASALEGLAEFNSKAIAAWRANAESTIAHWQVLAGVKSFADAISLSAEHTRKQMETLSTQTRELSALATRIVRDAADPLKMAGR